ncbi:hypothetical protein HNP86_002005 [Methanococcus maripaludis]|uniref:Uncharacterized protein n=1 Tax=Methanococcus maripaludis TaxID=39152 RepID=A0A7J9P1D8_METMI|nr:hypothetical protein [Methanococcus maripaludis]MBA2851846.1 hypothetical protein [Methanococcus maripaludis]
MKLPCDKRWIERRYISIVSRFDLREDAEIYPRFIRFKGAERKIAFDITNRNFVDFMYWYVLRDICPEHVDELKRGRIYYDDTFGILTLLATKLRLTFINTINIHGVDQTTECYVADINFNDLGSTDEILELKRVDDFDGDLRSSNRSYVLRGTNLLDIVSHYNDAAAKRYNLSDCKNLEDVIKYHKNSF